MTTAKHAFRGTMKALQELGLTSNDDLMTVDKVAKEIQLAKDSISDPNRDLISHSTTEILLVDPATVCNWKYHDRPESELGDVEAFANDLKLHGQIQPCIVRPSKIKGYKYELIVGERRWRATKHANLRLKIIIENINDSEAALKQISENEQRENLSDYSRGMSYAKLLNENILTIRELEKVLGKSKSAIDRLLSFSKIPNDIWIHIGEPTLISSRLAAEIRALLNCGDEYKAAIIQLAPKFKAKKITTRNIKAEVLKVLNNKQSIPNDAEEITSFNGRHLFTWRKDSNSNISISFPKDIRQIIMKDKIEHCLIKEIERQLDEIKTQINMSPRGDK